MSGDADDRKLLPPAAGEDVAVEWHEVSEEALSTLEHGPLHARTALLRRLWPVVDRPPAPLDPLRRAVEMPDGGGEGTSAGPPLAVPLLGGGLSAGVLLLFAPDGAGGFLAAAAVAGTAVIVAALHQQGRKRGGQLQQARRDAVAALRRHAFVHRGPGTLVVHLAVPRAELRRAATRLGQVGEQLADVRGELDGAREIAREAAALPVSSLDLVRDAGALQEHRVTVERLAADRHLLADRIEARLAELHVPEGGRALDVDLGPLLDGVDALVGEAAALHAAVVPSGGGASPG